MGRLLLFLRTNITGTGQKRESPLKETLSMPLLYVIKEASNIANTFCGEGNLNPTIPISIQFVTPAVRLMPILRFHCSSKPSINPISLWVVSFPIFKTAWTFG